MNWTGALLTFAACCGTIGLTCCAIDTWTQHQARRAERPGGRHRDPAQARAARARDEHGQLFERPTREQLRDEAARR